MDLAELRKLVQLMLRADLSELELDDKNTGQRVHLKRDSARRAEAGVQNLLHPGMVQMIPGPMTAGSMTLGAAPAAGAQAAAAGGPPPGTEVFKSPIVGTFYRSPSPDSEPFMRPGSRFDEGSVLCIIEAMKVMNEIRAEFRGEVVEVLAENGEPVEFGQPLFLIKKG
jgi:acetyl-CoA carboxylase biotin carboxyl carrier protein